MTFAVTKFSKPKQRPLGKERKGLNRVGRKGLFWDFCSKILTAFFLKIELRRVCESCEGSAYCGPLTPAHSRRRNGIRVGDWYYALRVAVLGSYCHFDIDSKGGPAAEPIIEQLITDRFAKMGLTDEQVKALLLECAAEVQNKNPEKYGEFLVEL